MSSYQNIPLDGATQLHKWSLKSSTCVKTSPAIWSFTYCESRVILHFSFCCKCAVYFVFLTPNSDFCFCFLHFLHLDYECTLWSGVHYSAWVFKSHFNHSGCDVTPKQLWGFTFDPFPSFYMTILFICLSGFYIWHHECKWCNTKYLFSIFFFSPDLFSSIQLNFYSDIINVFLCTFCNW